MSGISHENISYISWIFSVLFTWNSSVRNQIASQHLHRICACFLMEVLGKVNCFGKISANGRGGGQPLSGKKINFSQENKIVPMSLNMIKAWYKNYDPMILIPTSPLPTWCIQNGKKNWSLSSYETKVEFPVSYKICLTTCRLFQNNKKQAELGVPHSNSKLSLILGPN